MFAQADDIQIEATRASLSIAASSCDGEIRSRPTAIVGGGCINRTAQEPRARKVQADLMASKSKILHHSNAILLETRVKKRHRLLSLRRSIAY